MGVILQWLFGTARFVPHGVCLLWRPDLVAIHVVSDGLIALSYFAIPGVIWWFMRRRPDLEPEHRRIAGLFVLFIAACGLTHLAAIVTLWEPYYGLQALLKLGTAGVSVATACALPFLAPKLLKIPSAQALQALNGQLQAEVAAHRATLAELEVAQTALERRVADRDEEVRELNRRFESSLRNSSITLFEQDEALRYTWVFNPPLNIDAQAMIGRTEDAFMTPQSAQAVQALKREALAAGEVRQQEIHIGRGAGEGWFAVRVQPLRLRDGRRGLVATSTNITAQKQQQEHLQVVLSELNHRSKNLLTIVQSIARQTATGLQVPEAFMTRLSDRLRALASAHDVLVEGDWRGADLRAVIEGQLKHQLQDGSGRISLAGERFELAPEAAHYVGLAVHELGANAIKYGALSSDLGRVEVSWGVMGDGEGRRLELAWREAGGPAVEPAHRKGFGRTILEVLTPRALGGQAELKFAEEGIAWVLTAPLRTVVETPAAA